jgi:hypothetical protein
VHEIIQPSIFRALIIVEAGIHLIGFDIPL